MTLTQVFAILKARRWLGALCFLMILLSTLTVSLLLPKQYKASASVVVDAKPDPLAAIQYPAMASPGFMATQVDIINSERVALRVIRDLRLSESAEIRAQWLDEGEGKGTPEQWLVTLLQKKLEVQPSRESNIISISYTAPEPRFAAALVNAFSQAYLATTLELRVDPAKRFSAFFDVQSKEAREALEAAQAKLSAFQREKGIIATDERLDVENQRLSELTSQLVQLQAIASESSSRQAQAGGVSADRMSEVLTNPVVAGLKADVSRNEARLQELTSRLGDRHPQVVEAKANIAELQRRISAETQRVTGSMALNSNANRQREAKVRQELDEQRQRLLSLRAVRDEGQVLMREVESAQRNFDGVMSRATQSSLESQATQSYANVLTSALPPLEHSSPRLLVNLAIAAALGAVLSVAVCLVMEMTDRRVRTLSDINEALGLPVIGLLPRPNARRTSQQKRRAALVSQRLVGLPAPLRR